MIILSGIAISAITDNMLFERALSAKEKQEIADNLETLNLELNDYIISKSQNLDFNYKVGEYIDYAVNDNVFSDKDVSDEEEASAYVKMAKKYIYLVEKESNGNIKITYNRKISGNSVDLTDAVLAMDLDWITEQSNWTSTFPMTNRPDVVEDVTKAGTYGFTTSNGTLIAENKGISSKNTTADSCIKIDLSEYTTDYTVDLTINAKYSGYSYSYGWLVVTESANAIGYYSSSYLKDTVTNTTISKTASNVIMYANGNSSTWNIDKDYTYSFEGGKCYYLHFGYYRYSNYSTYGDDTLTINRISLTEKRKVPQITLSTETEGVDFKYMVENQTGETVVDWTDGEEVLKISDNGTERYLTYGDIIYGQIVSGENTSAISQIIIQDKEEPVIEITVTNTYSDEISVKVDVKDNSKLPETVLYDYYITEDGSDYPEEPENSEPIAETSYIFTGLTQKKTYKIKVVTHDAWNNEGYAETTKTTVAVPQGASINVNWNEREPSVYITKSSSYSHYKIQYQVNSTSNDGWNEINSGEYITDVVYGDTVYARLIDDTGNTSIYSSVTIILPILANKVNIGDYVAYNALAYDENNEAYHYTSETGTGLTHGSGYSSTQTFTSNSDIKWRVLSKDNGEVVLISEEPIQTDTEADFYLNGAIGYLYAEEELNRICAIYGHGTGANTSKIFTCQNGDTVEGLETVSLTGSGSRSINVDDINNITGYSPTTGFPWTRDHYYPTKTTLDGISMSKESRTEVGTAYSYSGLDWLFSWDDTFSVLFENGFGQYIEYMLASRCMYLPSGTSNFCVRRVYNDSVEYYTLGVGSGSGFNGYTFGRGVRPIVYLKSTVQTSGKNSSGAWTILDD